MPQHVVHIAASGPRDRFCSLRSQSKQQNLQRAFDELINYCQLTHMDYSFSGSELHRRSLQGDGQTSTAVDSSDTAAYSFSTADSKTQPSYEDYTASSE